MNTKNTDKQVMLDLGMEEIVEDTKKKTTPKKVATKKTAVKNTNLEEKKTTTKKKVVKEKTEEKAKTTKKTTKSVDENKEKTKVGKKVAVKKTTIASTDKSESKSDVAEKEKPKKANREITKKKIKEKEKIVVEKKLSEEDSVASKIQIPTVTLSEQPIVEDIKRIKMFFVSDMDEEADYLHDMSLQGYHFVTKKDMRYIFRQGESKNYFYHLGYYEKDKRDGDRYLENYKEAGWENIYHEKAEFDGVWNYFRIEMPTGVKEPNIFSDRESRLALYKRLLSSWRSLLAVDVICFLFLLFFYYFLSKHPSNMTGLFITLCSLLLIIVILIFIIYLRAYLKISKKQEELLNI